MSEYKEYGWKDGATNAHGFLYPTLIKILKDKRSKVILDIGCGNGEIANRLIKDGSDVRGTDASISGIEVANQSNPGRFFFARHKLKIITKRNPKCKV
jgi:2-polyprenyl-3-methyl-5-hydroxy-6-metoxy-1,4-benzoquinol methylase